MSTDFKKIVFFFILEKPVNIFAELYMSFFKIPCKGKKNFLKNYAYDNIFFYYN